MSRIGILGGTFDPPHKSSEKISSRQDRLAMLRLAVGGKENIEISEIEFDRRGPSYTVDTLEELRRQNPDDEFYFLIGADNISEMESWHQPEKILEMVMVVAAGRPGFSAAG